MKHLRRFFFGYIILFILLLLVESWAKYAEINFSISFIFYWMFLIAWLLAVLIWKFSSNFSMKLAFMLTLCAIALFILGLIGISEVLLRLGFVGWMVGVIQALVEYKNKRW